jgi:hypothetical protein
VRRALKERLRETDSSGAWAATSSPSCSPPRARTRRSRWPRRSSPSSARVGGVTVSVG